MGERKNVCGFRHAGPEFACAYYPCSGGEPAGRCWAMHDPNHCTHTANLRNDLIVTGDYAEKFPGSFWFDNLKRIIDYYIIEIRNDRRGGIYVSYEWLYRRCGIDPNHAFHPLTEVDRQIFHDWKVMITFRSAADQIKPEYREILHGIHIIMGE
jgi:hypothetical protein